VFLALRTSVRLIGCHVFVEVQKSLGFDDCLLVVSPRGVHSRIESLSQLEFLNVSPPLLGHGILQGVCRVGSRSNKELSHRFAVN
jgi:hypothetical protein